TALEFGLKDGFLESVKDPTGDTTTLAFNRESGLLESVVAPSGLKTTVGWELIPGTAAPYVKHMKTVDSNNNDDVIATREFNPHADALGRNFTGSPDFGGPGELFDA